MIQRTLCFLAARPISRAPYDPMPRLAASPAEAGRSLPYGKSPPAGIFLTGGSIIERIAILMESRSKIPILFQLLQQRGIKAKQLAEATGVSTGNISDWKAGRSKPSAEKLDRIAQYLGVSSSYLLGTSDGQDDDELGGVYLSIAREAQESNLDPDDVKLVIDVIKGLRRK